MAAPQTRQQRRRKARTSVPRTSSFQPLRFLFPIIVPLLAFIAFFPALSAGFVDFDDPQLYVNNDSFRGFSPEKLHWMLTTTFMGHYQPLTWLSAALDYQVAGLDPTQYHRTNVLLHAANALLVYFLAVRLFRAAQTPDSEHERRALPLAAAGAALLFAIHPLRVESVAWVAERRDVLSTFLLLAAALAYLRSTAPGQVRLRSVAAYAVSILLLALSLLAKAWGMSFVVLVTILDVYPLRRLPTTPATWLKHEYRPLWIQKIPYLTLGVAAALMAGYAQRSALDTMRTLEQWGLIERFVQACYGLAFYVWKTLWPAHLYALHELPYELDPLEPRFVAAYITVALAAALVAFAFIRRWHAFLAVVAVYLVTLAPVLGIAQSGPQLVAERYSYVSCLGWALLAGGGLLWLWRKRGLAVRISSGLALAAVLILLTGATWRQTTVWRDSVTLWTHALDVGRPSAIAHLNYAIHLRRGDRVDEAIEHCRAAVRIRPDAGNAWFTLANCLKQQGDYVEAEAAYREAVRFMTQANRAYFNLGNMYYNQLNRIDDAIAAYRDAIAHIEAHRDKLFSPMPYLTLGIALAQEGQVEEARELFEFAGRYAATRERARRELARLPAPVP